MLSIRIRQVRALTLVVAGSFMMLFSACQMSEMTRSGGCCDDDCPGHARVCEKPTIRALAQDLDALERHIERYGSVVIQHPSVWGQARLTQHRQDFENQMVLELPNFTATLQGTLSRSDQAYFMNALSLSAAASIKSGSSSGGSSSSSSSAAAPANPADAGIPADINGAFSGITRTPANLPALTGFGALAKNGVTLEPSTYLNQKARFLNHLNELRRINEGDDTGDSPGYALNLIRVPVSVLPGKCTERGHGAEVTMTLKPVLSEELLPTTFRNLVVNDLLEQIGVQLAVFLNDPENQRFMLTEKAFWEIKERLEEEKGKKYSWFDVDDVVNNKNDAELQAMSQSFRDLLKLPAVKCEVEKQKQKADGGKAGGQQMLGLREKSSTKTNLLKSMPVPDPVISTTKLRHARRPFPPSQLMEIYGYDESINVAVTAYDVFRRDPPNKYWVHYPEIQGWLQEELQGAYRFLADHTNYPLWSYCSPELVSLIHAKKFDKLETMRLRFADQVRATTKREIKQDVTVALAWAVIVESALLTDQLKQDMKESFAAKDCKCPHVDWLDYYLPDPSKEARTAFNKYVECRWPIIVFALDPVADQQNIADTFAQRREMQLALSLAFVNGNISAKNMTRYARRLESQMETVALNNTITGFSHGNETFGWRFYPRFQTPEIESNGKVFFRDLLIGDQSRDSLLKQRKLEPGQRECTAIVLMPSFVPYATMDVSSTWFKLTNPKCKDMTCEDAVKLSARVRAIDKCADRVSDADCYRDGELSRLKNKVRQLEARLPLQDMKVQIPYENTLGGFAMFNTGITDLAPELYGWYGSHGVNIDGDTTLFLIGNHFSVHQTRVIVGGKLIDPINGMEMMSRQVMRINIPAGASTIDRRTGTFPVDPAPAKTDPKAPAVVDFKGTLGTPTAKGTVEVKGTGTMEAPQAPADPCANPAPELFVEVHVATPYGVTSHLLIPALKKGDVPGNITTPAVNPVANWAPNAISVGYQPKGLGIASSSPPTVRPADLVVQLSSKTSTQINTADLTLALSGTGTGVTYTFTVAGVPVAKQQNITFSDTLRDAMIKTVFDKLGPQLNKDNAQTSPAKLTLKSIALKQDTAVVTTITVNADLAINFVPAAEEKTPAANKVAN